MMMRGIAAAFLMCAVLTGCLHVKGIVIEEPGGKPLTTARFSIGRPGSMGITADYGVDSHGRFDFFIPPLDENRVFVYDSAGAPEMTMRRFETWEFSEHMTVTLRRAGPSAIDTNLPLIRP